MSDRRTVCRDVACNSADSFGTGDIKILSDGVIYIACRGVDVSYYAAYIGGGCFYDVGGFSALYGNI